MKGNLKGQSTCEGNCCSYCKISRDNGKEFKENSVVKSSNLERKKPRETPKSSDTKAANQSAEMWQLTFPGFGSNWVGNIAKSAFKRPSRCCRFNLAKSLSTQINPRIVTKSGPVEGFKLKGRAGKEIVTFYGIPYAQAPIGELRFRAPVPVTPWKRTFQALETPNPCPQVVRSGKKPCKYPMVLKDPSEDCLKLNIWVPNGGACTKPVMVFIHGGGFLEGSSVNGYVDGKHLAEREDVIVVSMNYRLGPLGFMYLGEDLKDEVPGNVGLVDQQLAMKWVKNNIDAFGGDNGNITVFGCSAGSASVGLHLMSPGSKGLFHRAIMMSGSPANPRVVRDKEVLLGAVNRLLDNLGYMGDYDNKKDVLKFLRSVDCSALPIAGQYGTRGILDVNHFGPTVDGFFLPRPPMDYLDDLKFESHVDLMLGNVSDEGIAFFKSYYPDVFRKGQFAGLTEDQHFDVIKTMNNRGLTEQQISLLSNFYQNRMYKAYQFGAMGGMMLRDTALAVVSDGLYNMDTEFFSERYAFAGNNVYRYLFDQTLPIFKTFPEYSGAIHVSDQLMILGMRDDDLPNDLVNFGHEMSKRWATFARTGNPNLENQGRGVRWQKYVYYGRFYAILNSQKFQPTKDYRSSFYRVWRQRIISPDEESMRCMTPDMLSPVREPIRAGARL